jgi:hypothetical protein
MAYAKTTPAQVIAQLAIGASVGSLAWYSLRPSKTATLQDSAENTTATDPVAALDAETRGTTSGQLWGLPPKQDSLKAKLQDSSKKS